MEAGWGLARVTIAGLSLGVLGPMEDFAAQCGLLIDMDEDQPVPWVMLMPEGFGAWIILSGNLLAEVDAAWRPLVRDAWIAQALLARCRQVYGQDGLAAQFRDHVIKRLVCGLGPPLLLSVGVPCLMSGLFR